MQQSFSCGDKVVIVGGKYAGRLGHAVKKTEKMCSIKLLQSEEVVRVMLHNVHLYVKLPEEDQCPDKGVLQKHCCKLRAEVCAVAREELLNIQVRLDELIELLSKMGT
jgi:hypothetical protein